MIFRSEEDKTEVYFRAINNVDILIKLVREIDYFGGNRLEFYKNDEFLFKINKMKAEELVSIFSELLGLEKMTASCPFCGVHFDGKIEENRKCCEECEK